MADNNSLKERIGAGAMVVGVAAPLDSTTGVPISFRNGTPDQARSISTWGARCSWSGPRSNRFLTIAKYGRLKCHT